MTIEEAIRILDPETTVEALEEIEYYAGFSGPSAKVQACTDACEVAVAALREQQKRDKGCEYCTEDRKIPTHCDGEANITLLVPLPAIDLMTGEMEKTAAPSFFTIRIENDEMSEDFVPIRCCPMCGRELKEG